MTDTKPTKRTRYAARTVRWRFETVNEAPAEFIEAVKVNIATPDDVYSRYMWVFKDQVRERFVVLWLNANNKAIGMEVVTEGILNSSLVHPREVFRGAIVGSAASIILMHNHPSENPEPSAEDVAITRQMAEAGRMLGIPVHDHVIFTGEAFTSLAERGML